MSTTSPTASLSGDASAALDGLRARCPLHRPGDPGYDVARAPWNLAVDVRPAAVAVPRTVDEVRDVVRTAAAVGLRVAPQVTGHNVGPFEHEDLGDVVLLRLGALRGVTVDPDARTATVLGGTRWDAVVDEAARHGLTAAHGSAPDIGVVGYLLGGGLSFYGRRHGLAVNALRSADVVLPDGSLRTVDAADEELFWALRGGGASLGVVVSVVIDLLPYTDLVAGMLLYDRDRADDVARVWLDWTRTAPESATTSLRVMSFPPLPELPPFLSGRDLVVVDGAILEDDATAEALLAPLRALEPEIDTFGRIPAAGLTVVHMDPPAPVPAISDHCLLGDLDDAAVDAFLAQVGNGTRSGLMFAEIRHLGGAFARPADGGGALTSIEAPYCLLATAVAQDAVSATLGRQAAAAVVSALQPWAATRLAPTFTESVVDADRFHDAATLERLRAVRDQVDPDRVIRAGHAL